MPGTFQEKILEGGQTYHSVEVARNTKGYNWTVKVAGTNLDEIKKVLVETETFCKTIYGIKKD